MIRHCCCRILCLGLIALVGCEGVSEPTDVAVSQESLRTIEPLDFESFRASSVDVDANAPGAAGMDVGDAEPVAEVVAEAPAELAMSLEQCRSLALRYNLDLQVELLNPTIAAETVSEEEARFESLFFSDVSFVTTDTLSASSLETTQDKTAAVDMGVEIPLRTGGTVVFDLAGGRSDSGNQFTTLNPAYDSAFSASISQPLLRGGGVRTNTHAIRVARYQWQSAEALTKLEVIRVLAVVDRYYWQLYAAREELKVRRQEHDLAVAQLEWVKQRVAGGISPEVEIVRAEAGVASRLEPIIIAENGLRQRQRVLKRALNKPGLGMNTRTTLLPATEPDPVHYELDTERLVSASKAGRMEMLELELQIAQQASTIDFERNQALPLLALDYTYSVTGLGRSTSDSFDMVFDKDYEDHSAGLRVEVPLGNRAARSRLRRAIFGKAQRLATRRRRAAIIEQEVLDAADWLEATWQRVLASRQRAVLAARELEAEEKQFQLGASTSIDVLDTQKRFADAQSAEIAALTDYQIAQIDLAYATGTVLGAARVRWEPQEDADLR